MLQKKWSGLAGLALLVVLFFAFSSTSFGVVQAQVGLTARPGDYLDYSVVVSNSGPVVGTGVSVTDPIDISLAAPTSISNGGTYNAGTRTITWTGLSIPAASGGIPGTLTLTFRGQVLITVPAGTVVNNTAVISPPVEGGPGSTVTAPPVTIVTPNLSTSTKTVSGQAGPSYTARPGNTLTYNVTLNNTGPVSANNIPVTDVIDTALGAPTAISNGGTYNAATRTITWTGLNVWPAPTAPVALTYLAQVLTTATNGTVINNTAIISPALEGGPGGSPTAPPITVTTPNLSGSNKGVTVVPGP